MLYAGHGLKNGALDDCNEQFIIHSNFNWWEGQAVDATPIVIPGGGTTTINLNIIRMNLHIGGPYGC